MKDKNTMYKWEFLFHQLLVSFGLYGWYRAYIFVALPLINQRGSDIFLIIFSIVIGCFSIGSCWKWRRNHISVVVNATLPLGLYTILSYFDICLTLICIFLVIIVAVCNMYKIMMHMIHTPKQRKLKIYRRYIFTGQRTLIAGVLIVFMVGICVFDVDGTISLGSYEYGQTKEQCIDEMDALSPSAWKETGLKQRVQFAEKIIEIEMKSAGMEYRPMFRMQFLKPNQLGVFDGRNGIIALDFSVVTSEELLFIVETLLHEIRHAQQYELASLYERNCMDKLSEEEKILAKAFWVNFQNYKQMDKDGYELYNTQLVERDADVYAEENRYLYVMHEVDT